MSSNALEVKGKVKALIDGLPILADVQRTWGVPAHMDREWVNLGRVRWPSSDWVTNRSRQESFTIDLLVSVVQTAGDAESVETRAMQLAAAIEDAVKANPNFGMPSVVTSGFQPTQLQSFPNDPEGYEAQYECVISVTARL